MRAIGYVRVSTEEQAREGVSLDAQRARFAAWCVSQSIPEDRREIHADEGLSGCSTAKRPGLAAALASACAEPCVLVVYSLSRMARSVRDTLAIGDQLERAGSDLVSLSESIDTTSASGKMIFRLFAVLAEFERDLIIERTIGGLDHKRRLGHRLGSVPRGSRLDPDGKTLRPDDVELAGLARVATLAAGGLGPRVIARIMAAEFDRPWPESTIRRILKRQPR